MSGMMINHFTQHIQYIMLLFLLSIYGEVVKTHGIRNSPSFEERFSGRPSMWIVQSLCPNLLDKIKQINWQKE